MGGFDGGEIVARIALVGAAAATGELNRLQGSFDSTAARAEAAGVGMDSADAAAQGVAVSARTSATALQSQATASERVAGAAQAAAVATAEEATAQDAAAASATASTAAQNTNAQSRRGATAAEREGAEAARAMNRTQSELAAAEEAAAERRVAAQAKLGMAFAIGGAAVAAFGVLAIKEYADFDKSMSAVNATVQAGAKVQGELRDAAIAAGAATSFSATEAADAENELAKAGVSTSAILGGGLAGALSLAAAGQLGVADSAQIAATALTQFNLKGSDVPHVADLLAAGAGKAQGSVKDLSMALNQGGLVASQMGISVEDTTGVLAAFASAGLIGSDSGTSFKTMLLALANPSKQASDTLSQYNIQAYDTNGNMVSMANLAGQLHDRLGGVSQAQRDSALATIFGSDAIRAANVLYKNGQSGIEGWTDKVNDAGYAAKQASMLQDNLSGDIEKLGGSFSSAFIESGGGANAVIRTMVQGLTGLVNVVGSIPAPILGVGAGISLIAGGVLLFGGIALAAVPKVVEFNASLVTLASSGLPGVARGAAIAQAGVARLSGVMSSTGSFLAGPWGIALAAAAVGVIALTKYVDSLEASTNDFQNVIKTAKSADDLFKVADKGTLISELDKATDSAKDFQGTLATLNTGGFKGGFLVGMSVPAQQLKQRLSDLGEQLATTSQSDLPSAQRAFSLLAEKTNGSDKQMGQLLNTMPAYKEALKAQATQAGQSASQHNLLKLAQKQAVPASDAAKDAFNDEAQAAQDTADALDSVIDSLQTLNGTNQDAIKANANWLESLAEISSKVGDEKDAYEKAHGSLKGFNLTLDQSTQMGAANADSLSQVAKTAQTAAKAQFDLDSKTMSANDATAKYVRTLSDQRSKFVNAATAAGYSKDSVNKLADAVFALPSAKEVKILASTAGANAAIFSFGRNLDVITRARTVSITAVTKANTTGLPVDGSYKLPIGKADGGILHYANGGTYRENHIAEKVAAGTMRVFAEPETGGEAYIPLAQSKRGRSMQVLEDVASQFGYELTKSGAPAAASTSSGAGSGSMVGMRIEGTMDLGNGLVGMVSGIVSQAMTAETDAIAGGAR